MLKTISVQNYALIDSLQLHFGKGMNIITGETGAGKSVLMGALGLLLGDRADSSSLLDTSKKCIIEGTFFATQKVKSFLQNSELDADDEVVIHREINKEGKSRSFINDTPVNLSQLRELGDILVDIHSQHETLLLNQSGFQLSVVDAFAGNEKLLSENKLIFRQYKALREKLNQLQEEEKKSRTDQDYLQFQFNELNEAKLEADEQSKLEEELSALSHAEEIKINIDKFSTIVSGTEVNLVSTLSNATGIISSLGKYLP
jgi:DNA repair protein RecN (Recombination protein N)